MQEDTRSNAAEHILKILVVHGADREDPVDVSILLPHPFQDVAVLQKLAHC